MSVRGGERVSRTADAEVVAIWVGTQRVLVREIATGRAFEASAPVEIAKYLHVGVRAVLYLDGDDQVIGWYVPDKKLGVREDVA